MVDNQNDPVRSGIARLRGRWWRVSLLRTGLRGLFYVLFGAALTLAFFPEVGVAPTLLVCLGLTALVALVVSGLLAPDEVAHAKAYDDAGGLADRVSSSIELKDAAGPMVEVLRAEAAQVAAGTPAESVYPYDLPKEGRWLPVPALLVAAAIFLPALLAPEAQADEVFVGTLEDRIELLEDLLSEERDKKLSKRSKEILEELEKLMAELDNEKVDKKDTQAEVSKLLDQLQKEEEQQKDLEQKLKELLKSLQENTAKQEMDPHLQQGDYQQALNKLREKLEELQKELEKKRKEGASPEELKELEELIQKLKEVEAKLMQLMQLDMDLNFLGKAIDFLHDFDGELGDLDEFDPAAIEPGEP